MTKVKWVLTISIMSLVYISTPHLSFAEGIPQLINYESALTDSNGDPVANGQYDVTFSIYASQTGGSAIWTETWDASTSPVATYGGRFNVMLGSHTTIPVNFFHENPVTYLSIKIGDDSEMLPRQRITSVAYAFRSSDAVPKGGIIMWSGSVNEIPDGWRLCDGNNGTPNLTDKFIVGAGNEYDVTDEGGEKQHTLTIEEMPSHTHIQNAHSHPIQGNWNSGNSGYIKPDSGQGLNSDVTWTGTPTTATNQHTGGGGAHENRPPYYALAFIMKI